MNYTIKYSLIFILFFTLFSGCSENISQQQPEPQLDLTKYNYLSETLSNDLNYFGDELRASDSNFGDSKMIKQLALKHYGENSENSLAFNNAYLGIIKNKKLDETLSADVDLTESQKEHISRIRAKANAYSNLTDYKDYLDTQFSTIAKSEMSNVDKDFLLSYITIYSAGLNFMDENLDLFQVSGVDKEVMLRGWWSDWGKCAAGIVGGVLVGAGTVALASAAAPITGGGVTCRCLCSFNCRWWLNGCCFSLLR